MQLRGAWVAQLVKHLTLDFSSDHDPTIRGFEPHVKNLLEILSFSLSAPHLLMLSKYIHTYILNFFKNLTYN